MTFYLVTLGLTLVVETFVALVLSVVRLLEIPRSRLWTDVPLASLATHPVATFAVGSLEAPFWIVELGVIAAEFVIYRIVTRASAMQALLLSVATNTATIFIALAL